MDPNTPLVLAGAKYANRETAMQDFHSVWDARRDGEFDHMTVAVLTKDESGELQVDRHNSTTRKGAWGGAMLGAALVLVAPAAGLAAVAVGGGAAAGAGGIVGYFWHTIPKDKVREVGDLLDSGESGLLIVAVNQLGTDIKPLLTNAERSVVIDTKAGDLDTAFSDAVKKQKAEPVAS
jgi:uncharacterized membrane protein